MTIVLSLKFMLSYLLTAFRAQRLFVLPCAFASEPAGGGVLLVCFRAAECSDAKSSVRSDRDSVCRASAFAAAYFGGRPVPQGFPEIHICSRPSGRIVPIFSTGRKPRKTPRCKRNSSAASPNVNLRDRSEAVCIRHSRNSVSCGLNFSFLADEAPCSTRPSSCRTGGGPIHTTLAFSSNRRDASGRII